MTSRLPAVLAVLLAAGARAGTVRVEVVPELGGLGSAPAATTAPGAISLQLSAHSLVPMTALAAPAPAAPPARLTPVPAAVQPAVAQERPLLIRALAAPALQTENLGVGEASGAAEKDFYARAQLDGPAALVAGAVSAPSYSQPSFAGSVLRLLKPAQRAAAPSGDSSARDGSDAAGARMKAALKALDAAPDGSVLPLDFVPSRESLRAISELTHEVFLHRRKADGRWLIARGDRHGVRGDWEEYDLALHNHPEARIGVYSMRSAYPSPEDLETAAGKDARFFVISSEGIVEWNSFVPPRIAEDLASGPFGRFVMRLTFPSLYPALLARRGVAAELRPWRKVTTDWLESGSAPLNERILIEKTIPALAAEEFPVIAAKLGRGVDSAYEARVLTRTNGYRMYWHSNFSYKDHPDNLGIPDGHFSPKFGIRLMVKPDWRRLKDLRAHFRPLFAHEYAHWLQHEGFISRQYGSEIAAVAVETLRAIELIGLDAVRAGRAGTVHSGITQSFDDGRAWARGGFREELAPYAKGVLAGAAYEAGLAAGRPEAAWEFLRLVITAKDPLEPAAAWARVVGSR